MCFFASCQGFSRVCGSVVGQGFKVLQSCSVLAVLGDVFSVSPALVSKDAVIAEMEDEPVAETKRAGKWRGCYCYFKMVSRENSRDLFMLPNVQMRFSRVSAI